ncbi:endo-1,4-beta-xylanase [Sphingomonas sp. So64.6b]|uniref:endo-1,4-beta-xylanase n=1 Tax=Sphingomonas sp. So64.6b TaxID=2997354 RepID=UPI0016035EAE|nr:endo-1,4-beta-xylanase [Sphingomonas sp. So64.6b]QNA83289.1 endo-1,4-beta-xylanase [Sphingomonas sp. So64.6b]
MDIGASRRDLLATMCILPLVAISGSRGFAAVPPLPLSVPPVPVPIPLRAGRFGTAVRPDQLVEASPLRDAITADCDLIVPEYHGQWSAVEWRRGDPWYGNYDAITEFASAHGKRVRGHSLIWEQMTPDWAREEMRDKGDWRTIERHFATLLSRYRGTIGEWIVVNEMIDTENGHGDMRRTGFQRAYGNDYVRRALETAHGFDPGARLMINDYSLCHDNPVDEARRIALLKLVERLKHDGAPLHLVGLQGHLELAKGKLPQARLARFLAELAAMEVEISITELDVLEADRTLPVAQRDRNVADAITALLDVALDQPALTSVVTWGLSDRDSWLQDCAPQTKEAQTCTPVDCGRLNRGLPYDGEMAAKPVREVLGRAMT